MSASDYFFNINALERGIHRKLTDGMEAHIFPAEQSMASVVVIAPNAVGTIRNNGAFLSKAGERASMMGNRSPSKREIFGLLREIVNMASSVGLKGLSSLIFLHPRARSIQNPEKVSPVKRRTDYSAASTCASITLSSSAFFSTSSTM